VRIIENRLNVCSALFFDKLKFSLIAAFRLSVKKGAVSDSTSETGLMQWERVG